jgi:CubicO group peptidase (beta-lactamase class C family)
MDKPGLVERPKMTIARKWAVVWIGFLIVLAWTYGARTAESSVALQQPVESDAQALRMEKAFTEWVNKNSVANANLVVVRDSAVILKVGLGKSATSKAVGVASLSKAITGVCIIKLVEAHKLAFDTALGALLTASFKKHPPKDVRARDITIGQLLTHASGITNDPSQGIAFNQFQPFGSPSMDKQFEVALAVPLGSLPGAGYFYNNMNYAALGVVIESVTGESYGEYCGREVLKSVGVNDATLKWEWASRGAYGGWKISPEGYAKFLDYFDPSKKLLDTPSAAWPKILTPGGSGYSVGINTRRNNTDIFHFGDFNWTNPPASYGAYFDMWHQGIRFVVTYSPNISHAVVEELDAALYRAAFQP